MDKYTQYFVELGLPKGAKQIEIKNAYRNLARIYHPDVEETGSEEKFKKINEAYEKLFDEKLYKEEMEELKKNPNAYHQARAKYPLVFVDDGETSGKNTKNTTNTTNTTSKKPVPTYYTRNQKKPTKTTKTPPPKKKDNGGSDIVPFCIGGAVVAIIIALLSFPPVILIIIIALGAYWLLK